MHFRCIYLKQRNTNFWHSFYTMYIGDTVLGKTTFLGDHYRGRHHSSWYHSGTYNPGWYYIGRYNPSWYHTGWDYCGCRFSGAFSLFIVFVWLVLGCIHVHGRYNWPSHMCNSILSTCKYIPRWLLGISHVTYLIRGIFREFYIL